MTFQFLYTIVNVIITKSFFCCENIKRILQILNKFYLYYYILYHISLHTIVQLTKNIVNAIVTKSFLATKILNGFCNVCKQNNLSGHQK